jgi:hypothetical protein
MSPMTLRAAVMRSSRRRLVTLVVLLGLSGAVAVHHAMPMDMSAMPGHAVCVAALLAGALLVRAVVLVRAPRPRPRRVTKARALTSRYVLCDWTTSARAGPRYLRLNVLRL